MKFDRHARRKLFSHTIAVITGLCVIAILYPLVNLIYTAVQKGGTVLFQLTFLTAITPNACSAVSCETVGIGPAVQGTIILVGLASLISVPVGVLAAIFATEYRTRGLGRAISFTADVLSGVPSIIMGAFIFGYFVLYNPTIVYSTISGSLALSVIMIPIITRTTEEALRTVPIATREAALALGISKWKATLRIVLIGALPGILTGVLLGVMRAAGEAAPLLFTAFGSQLFFRGLNQPVAALPLLIYYYALSSASNWQAIAWGATLFLLGAILITNVVSRYVIHRLGRQMVGGT